jgi:hypothetical protein
MTSPEGRSTWVFEVAPVASLVVCGSWEQADSSNEAAVIQMATRLTGKNLIISFVFQHQGKSLRFTAAVACILQLLHSAGNSLYKKTIEEPGHLEKEGKFYLPLFQ